MDVKQNFGHMFCYTHNIFIEFLDLQTSLLNSDNLFKIT